MKKLLAFILGFIMLSTTAFAAVDWAYSDYSSPENIISDPGFDASSGTVFTNATVTSDPISSGMGNVAMFDGGKYVKLTDGTNGKLTNLVNTGVDIVVEFDYYIPSNATKFRCELRSIASSEITSANQDPYWDGFSYAESVSATTTWQHFKATMKTKDLKDYYAGKKTLNTNFQSCYFYLGITGSNFYFDNLKISAAKTILPLEEASYNYGEWIKDESVADNYGNSGNVYKTTVNVGGTTAGSEPITISGISFDTAATYRLSLYYKEDAANLIANTRMWRPYVNTANNIITGPNGEYLCYNTTEGTDVDIWKKASLDFTIGEEELNDFAAKGIKVYWQGLGSSDPSKHKDYTIYVANLKLTRLPAATTNTVSLLASSVTVKTGENAEIGVDGYADDYEKAVLTINGQSLETSKNTSGAYSFDVSDMPIGVHSATFKVTDKWGTEKSFPITIIISDGTTKNLSVTTAKWSSNLLKTTEYTKGIPSGGYMRFADQGGTDAETILYNQFTKSIAALYNEGYSVVKVSFKAKTSENTELSTNLAQNVELRTGSSNEFTVTMPKDTLDGEWHTYEGIFDLGSISSQYIANNKTIERFNATTTWTLFLRNRTKASNIEYKDISIQYLISDKVENGANCVAANLYVSNDSMSTPLEFKGVVVLAEYDNNNSLEKVVLTSADYKTNDWDKLSAGCSRNAGTVIENYNPTHTYKAFCVDSLNNLIPLLRCAELNLDASQKKKLLIIGNSYSVDSVRYVHDMAKSVGADIDTYLIQHGGATVYDLYVNRSDTSYYLPIQINGHSTSQKKSLDALLDDETFDYVVMQNYWGSSQGIINYVDNSTSSSKENNYKAMAEYIREKQPNTEIMINAVWSNEHGYNVPEKIDAAARASSFAEMTNYVQRYFYDQEEKFNGQAAIDCSSVNGGKPLTQMPVGYAIQLAREYETGGNKPFFTTCGTDLLSLYVDGGVCPIGDADKIAGRLRLNRDGYHLSLAGRYLAGLVWTQMLTECDVNDIAFVPTPEMIRCGIQASDGTSTTDTINLTFDPITAVQQQQLKVIAGKAVNNYKTYGTRGLADTAMPLD